MCCSLRQFLKLHHVPKNSLNMKFRHDLLSIWIPLLQGLPILCFLFRSNYYCPVHKTQIQSHCLQALLFHTLHCLFFSIQPTA